MLINRCRLNILLASLFQLINPESEDELTIPNLMRDVISYINNHLNEPIMLDKLAKHFFSASITCCTPLKITPAFPFISTSSASASSAPRT